MWVFLAIHTCSLFNVICVCLFQYFELKLDNFGPYNINYSRNGRYESEDQRFACVCECVRASINLHFPKDRLFCLALVCLFFEWLGDEYFSW